MEKNAQKRRDGTWAENKSGRERESLRETDGEREIERDTERGERDRDAPRLRSKRGER